MTKTKLTHRGPKVQPQVQRRKQLTTQLQAMKTLDKSMTTELIKLWNPKFIQWAHQYTTSKFEVDDVYQNCCLWLIEALQDATHPGDDRVYHYVDDKLKHRYNNKVNNEVSISQPNIRKNVDAIVDEQAVDSDYRLDMLILHTSIQKYMEQLNADEYRILCAYYSFNDHIYWDERMNAFTTELPNEEQNLTSCYHLLKNSIFGYHRSYQRMREVRSRGLHQLRYLVGRKLDTFNY